MTNDEVIVFPKQSLASNAEHPQPKETKDEN